jgi:copper homeostasis protein (lipoprotein)
MKIILNVCLLLLILITVNACKHITKNSVTGGGQVIFRGLYSFGPEVKSFKDCGDGQEYWVADSSAKLELSYAQMHFEKPNEPVYVEVEATKMKSGLDGIASEFDSTLVVKKLIKITSELPKDCN